jgi:hypothetical protein
MAVYALPAVCEDAVVPICPLLTVIVLPEIELIDTISSSKQTKSPAARPLSLVMIISVSVLKISSICTVIAVVPDA